MVNLGGVTRRCVHCNYPADHLDRAGWCDECATAFAQQLPLDFYGAVQLPLPLDEIADEPEPPCPDWLVQVAADLEMVKA